MKRINFKAIVTSILEWTFFRPMPAIHVAMLVLFFTAGGVLSVTVHPWPEQGPWALWTALTSLALYLLYPFLELLAEFLAKRLGAKEPRREAAE